MTNADYILHVLKYLEVGYLFGVQGGAIGPLYDALEKAERTGGPFNITCRHEGDAAFMADGYAKTSGHLGVCVGTSGPGATNMVTGLASAMLESTPLLAITAQTPLHKFGRRAMQDSSDTGIDTVAILKACTKYSTLVSHEDQLIPKLITAIKAALAPTPGPVHLSIPTNILEAPAKEMALPAKDIFTSRSSLIDEQAIAELASLLAHRNNICFVIGENSDNTTDEIISLSEKLNATMVATPGGLRWAPVQHPRFAGVFGFAEHSSAVQALVEAEVIVSIGATFSEWNTGNWDAKLLNNKLVTIDTTPAYTDLASMANLQLYGSLPATLRRLKTIVASKEAAEPRYPLLRSPYTLHDSRVSPQLLVETTTKDLPREATLTVDVGNIWSWVTHYTQQNLLPGNFLINTGYGTMGYAPAAIGAAFAKRTPALCLIGDGAFLMAGQELSVAKQYGLPVIYVVFNDSSFGMVRHLRMIQGVKPMGDELSPVDFTKMAEAMGIEGLRISSNEELRALDFKKLYRRKEPLLIDALVDVDAVPLIGARVSAIGGATTKPGKKIAQEKGV
ncbi:MAG TPA: thiamine pyrophosphate-binding protein [Verrucomicrobiae bacterium]|nr:thiamine pyrophosphate-binding protein [Verrucomicrobiae bacterium]